MKGLAIGEAAERYSMLTIGDGLVTQIPALLVSTRRRCSSSALERQEPGYNLMRRSRPAEGALIAGDDVPIGPLPGMPSLPFTCSRPGCCCSRAARAGRRAETRRRRAVRSARPRAASERAERRARRTTLGCRADRIALEIGYR
jgi:flagellar biosynthesis component FlhA